MQYAPSEVEYYSVVFLGTKEFLLRGPVGSGFFVERFGQGWVFGRFGQARGPVVSWSLVPWSAVPWSLVLWSRGPLVPWSSGPVCATILAQSRSILRESTFRVFVLYIGQSRCGDKGFTVSGVNPEDPKAQKLQYTPHMNPLRTRHNDVVFANGGGCGPPTPPLSF